MKTVAPSLGVIFCTGVLVWTIGAWSSCTPSFRHCDDIPQNIIAPLPKRLSDSGLFRDMKTEELAEGVHEFRPRFALYTDGAEKRRWIFIPPGSAIDTTNMDSWQFPAGTKLWKEFSRGGVRVETRLLVKHGPRPGEWTPVAYVWSDDGDAWLRTEGEEDVRGTPHDVPSAAECMGCHGGTQSFVLGFSAIQLPEHSDGKKVGLDWLQENALLTRHVARTNELPGNTNTRRALGYLHANCSHCHNPDTPQREGQRCFAPQNDLDFTLRVDELQTPEQTATYRTAVGQAIVPGEPWESNVMIRMQSRDPWWGMPALGTESVDVDGTEVLGRWIAEL